MIYLDLPMDVQTSNTTSRFVAVAAAAHVALLLWNPILFRHLLPTKLLFPEQPPFIVTLEPEGLGSSPAIRPLSKTPPRPVTLERPHSPIPKRSTFIFTSRPPIESGLQTLNQNQPSAPIQLSGKKDISLPVPQLQSKQRNAISAAATPRTRVLGRDMDLGGNVTGIPSTLRGDDSNMKTGGIRGGAQESPFPIDGPLANRKVLHRVTPEYPAWAEEQGIIGSVRLYFTVTKAGQVSSNIRVEHTSGYPELDRKALDALKQWRFTPTTASETQWGIITFSFSLSR